MTHPATLLSVKFKTDLSLEEVKEIIHSRIDQFRDSELRKTIAAAYEVVGEPRVEVFRVMLPLKD